MNHCQLKVRRRVVYWESPSLGEHNCEQGGKAQKVSGTDCGIGMRERFRDDTPEIGGAGSDREAEDRERDRRLSDRRDGHFATSAHAAKRGARIEPRQSQEESAQQEQVDNQKQIADPIEWKRSGNQRNEQRNRNSGREDKVRCKAKDPGGIL